MKIKRYTEFESKLNESIIWVGQHQQTQAANWSQTYFKDMNIVDGINNIMPSAELYKNLTTNNSIERSISKKPAANIDNYGLKQITSNDIRKLKYLY